MKPAASIRARLASRADRHRSGAEPRTGGHVPPALGALVYELLDAHADTADLAAELTADPRWAAHLDYLRALQRVGRGALAESSREDAA
jgi:hypothetical protein